MFAHVDIVASPEARDAEWNEGKRMARLHERGVDLLLNVQSALEHLDKLTSREIADLLKESEVVLRDLLARDVPRDEPAD